MRKSWVLDEKAGRLVPMAEYHARVSAITRRCRVGSPMVITDLQPHEVCRSPVDGSLLSSRADIREHNRRNGVVDVGNDPAVMRPRHPEPSLGGGTADVLRAAIDREIPLVPSHTLPSTIIPE